MASNIRLRLITPGDHFLYLPLYFAGFRKFFDRIPERYHLVIESLSTVTDDRAFHMLTNRSYPLYADVAFAVCDPTVLLKREGGGGSHPVVAAALVTNTAFWVVDHRVNEVETLGELRRFQRVVAFHPGTTGHRIAKHIVKAAGNNMAIDCVDMGAEILRFTQSDEGTLVLSPNLLEIDELVADRDEHQIAFILANAPEFSNVLVTSLVTRQDVIYDHPELFRGLLTSLAYSMMKVRAADDDVVTYASGRFNRSEDRIRKVLEVALRSHVLPTNLEVSLPQWENAAKAYYETISRPFDEEAKLGITRMFRTHIGPHSEAVARAVARAVVDQVRAEEKANASAQSARNQKLLWATVAVTGILGATAAAAGDKVPVLSVSAGGLAALAFGYGALQLLPLRENKFARALHIGLFIGLVTLLCLFRLGIVTLPYVGFAAGPLVSYWIKLGLGLSGGSTRRGEGADA